MMDLGKLLRALNEDCRVDIHAPVVVGVSGGPDSLALLDGLWQLRVPVIAAHFDHRLRPDSGLDADVVQATAKKMGIPFVKESADVASYARQSRLTIEAAARDLRYGFLFSQARHLGAQAVAVAHTAGDQAETVLLHLLRGSGIAGLAGMRPRTVLPAWDAEIPLVRPLLSFDRAEILAHCQEQGLQPRTDPTNADTIFLRNRVRLELLPLLETYNPQIRRGLIHLADIAAGETEIVQNAVEAAWEGCLAEAGIGRIDLRREMLLGLAPALRRGVLRKAAACLAPPGGQVDFRAIQRVDRFIGAGIPGRVDLTDGVTLSQEGSTVHLAICGAELPRNWPQLEANSSRPVQIPGVMELPGGWVLAAGYAGPGEWPLSPTKSTISPWEAWLDASSLPEALMVRPQKPGDRFQPFGMQGHSMKLSDFWINQKVSRRARAGWPLVTGGERVVWIPGFRIAYPYRLTPETQRVVHLRLFRPE